MKASDSQVEKALLDSVSETMQEIAFMEAVPVRKYWARLPLLSPKHGALVIGITRELAMELAETMLHMGPDDITDGVLLDVTAELGNTVAGSFLRNYIDPEVIFELGLPETGIGWPELEDELVASYTFNVDEHAMLVVLAGHDFRTSD